MGFYRDEVVGFLILGGIKIISLIGSHNIVRFYSQLIRHSLIHQRLRLVTNVNKTRVSLD